jgi:CheY-like chemotaxis protein
VKPAPTPYLLIVDDDLATRVRLRDLLEREGHFQVKEASDGYGALETARQSPPDLILLDIMMPGITGLEVCRELRADPNTREVPIIVLSAAEESDAMIAALNAGADDFLRKPFWAPELRAKVRNVARLNRYRTLTRERDRFRWLLDRSQEPLLIADAGGRITYANSRAVELFGPVSAAGEDVVAVISRHFESEPREALADWRARRGDEGRFRIFQPETEHLAARWFDVEVQGLEEDGDTLIKFTNRSGWIRRELETYTFQHLISHKIRTPLNGLAPILSFLEATQGASGEFGDMLRVARQSAQRLEDTLCGVLQYHNAVFGGANGASPKREPLATVLERAAEAAGLEGKLTLDSNAAGATVAFPEVVEIVATELFDNYAKFSAAKTAGVRAGWSTADGGRQEICLVAPGPELPPDLIAQLGRPYWQPERSFTGEVPGVGLGLATARQLLRSRGGDLRLLNNATVRGVECRMILPSESRA